VAVWALTLVIALVGAGLLYRAGESARLQAEVAANRADQQRLRADALLEQTKVLSDRSRTLEQQAASPVLRMWNACGDGPCQVGPGSVRVGSVPDTFQLQLQFSSSVPINVYIFTFSQWTQFDSCGFALRCVTGQYKSFGPSSSVNQTFDDAEGCSGYVWVLQAAQSGTITPDVRVAYKPAAHPTGICATSP